MTRTTASRREPASPGLAPAELHSAPARLTILYDERCALCRRARDWLLTQPCLVEVELMAAGSAEAARRYGSAPWLGQELIVVDEHGRAWIGPAAFLACMWATARYRSWAFRLSRPSLAPHAEQFFRWVSAKRGRWGSGIDENECSWCDGERAPADFVATTAPRPVAPLGPRCQAGHSMDATWRFCRVCGSSKAPEG